MIVLLQGDLGDQITMLPSLVAEVARSKSNDPHVILKCHPLIKPLVPSYPWLYDERDLPAYFNTGMGISLNVWKAVEKYDKQYHPTRMFFHYLGLDDPGDAVQPEIVVDENAPSYDYVIAPFANDPARQMDHGILHGLCLSLISDGFIVAVVGGGLRWNVHLPENTRLVEDKPLPYVAGIMRNARKAVITVDSMANRLAHATGIKNHILLCSDVVPIDWATHPRLLKGYYGKLKAWRLDDIMGLIP